MKYWDRILKENLTYEEASKFGYFTRAEWDGVHFHVLGELNHYILLKNGKVLKNPSYVQSTDRNDWMQVGITTEAWRMICRQIENGNIHCDFCLNIVEGIPMRSGEETIYHNDKGFGIYMEQFAGEYAILENVKFCPCCGRRLEEEK